MSEWQTFILGPWAAVMANPYLWTFPCLPQVQSGHTKTFPPRATLGPTDPDIDDTLSTANWMDLTGGQGVSVIKPATDMGRTWWHIADLRYTDGWTTAPEVVESRPAVYEGNCTPVGTIGETAYAVWGRHLHAWDPVARDWGPQQTMLPTSVDPGGGVAFDKRMWFPTGVGYASVAEVSRGVLGDLEEIDGDPCPPNNGGEEGPIPHPYPQVALFGVFRQQLWALTSEADGYHLCSYTPSLVGVPEPRPGDKAWFWPWDNARECFPTFDKTIVPLQLISWVDALGQGPALWLITDHGCLRWNSTTPIWEETPLWNVPPHPNWGRCALPFRPGEALWIASGGGDLTQSASNGVIVPASGPGGRGEGMPADKRGDIVSMATDLANLYVLVRGQTTTAPVEDIEDTEGADPLYVPSPSSVTSVIAGTGKGWHPLWQAMSSEWQEGAITGEPTEIRAAKTLMPDNVTWDFTLFWGIGERAFSMPCRLTSHSAAQGRQANIDRFSSGGVIELGEFNAGSINAKKLWSHAALKMKFGQAPKLNYAELRYTTDLHPAEVSLGYADVSRERIVLPFGLDQPFGSATPPRWSAGLATYWIKPFVYLFGQGGLASPVVEALSLSYLPLRMDASHMVFTVPLPVEVDERSGKTEEQIHHLMHDLLRGEEFYYLRFQAEEYRVSLSGMSHTEIAGQDFVGAIKLNLIQVPTGYPGLVGEVQHG